MVTRNLGKLATELNKIVTQKGHYGYVMARQTVANYGFRTVSQAINEIQTRTNYRVVTRLDLDGLITKR